MRRFSFLGRFSLGLLLLAAAVLLLALAEGIDSALQTLCQIHARLPAQQRTRAGQVRLALLRVALRAPVFAHDASRIAGCGVNQLSRPTDAADQTCC